MSTPTQTLLDAYRARPDLFSLDQVDQLQKMADAEGLPFQKNLAQEEQSIIELPKQLMGGFIEGMTAVLDPFDKPKDMAGQIAHELGSLSGFVGSFFGLEIAGPLLGKSVGAIAGGLRAADNVTEAAIAAGEVGRFTNFAKATERFSGAASHFRSVPMLGADLVMKYAGLNDAARAAGAYFGDSALLETSIKSAAHLGVASSVAALHYGLMPALQAGISGAVFGGLFNGIGNIPFMKSETTLDQMFRAIAGGLVQGIPATVENAPTAVQIKDYLLGSYFGWNAMSAEHYLAAERFEKIGDPNGYKSRDEYTQAPKDIRDAMDKVYEVYKKTDVMNGMVQVLSMHPGFEEVKNLVKEQADTQQPDVAVQPTTAPYQAAEVAADHNEDYSPTRIQLTNKLAKSMTTLFKDTGMSVEEYNGHLKNTDSKLSEIVSSGGGWDEFHGWLKTLAEQQGSELSDDMLGPFKQIFEWKTSEQPHAQGVIDDDNIVQYKPDQSGSMYSADRTRIEANRSANIFDFIYGKPDLFMTVKEVIVDGKPKSLSQVNLYDEAPEEGSRTPQIAWKKIFDAGHKAGRYFFANNGDKAQFKFAKYHPIIYPENPTDEQTQTANANIKRITDAIAANKDWASEYATGRALSVDRYKLMTAEQYKKAVYSNIMYAEDYLGKHFTDWQGEGDWIKKALAYNKRQQPLFSDYASGREDVTGIPHIGVAIVKDWVDSKAGVREQALPENMRKLLAPTSDGAWILHSTAYDALAKGFGLPNFTDAIKPFVVSRHPELGTLIGKMAIHRATPEMDKMMEEAGIESMMTKSAAKQTGLRVVNDFDVKDGKLDFGEGGADQYDIPIEDIKVSFGTYDNANLKINFGVRIAKQIMDNLTAEQSSPEARKAFGDFLLDLWNGIPEANEAMAKYMRTRSPEDLRALIDYNALGELSDKSLFHDIGFSDVIQGMIKDPKFRQLANTVIGRSGEPGLDDNEIEFDDDGEQGIEAMQEALNGAMRFIKESNGSDAVTMSKPVKKMFDAMLTSYFVRKVTSPKIRGAGKATMAPYTPDMWDRLPLLSGDEKEGVRGNFYLGDSFKNLRIQKGMDGKGVVRQMTLEEQYLERELYKKEKDAKPEILEQMNRNLRAVVLRVPMDDISGMQSLDFAGFTGTPGGSIVLHGRTMNRLGGADLDIDSAFFYFGMPDAVHDTLYKNRNVQEHYDENYPRSMQALERTKDLPLKEKFMGMFDPLTRGKMGSEVAKGRNLNLGIAVANKSNLGFLYSVIKSQVGKDKDVDKNTPAPSIKTVSIPDNASLKKGSVSGDAKDAAMRDVATGFIGEVVNKQSSSHTSAVRFRASYEVADDQTNEITTSSTWADDKPGIIMLARNSERRGLALTEDTKQNILGAFKRGNSFVVGDMPGVDSQFIDYLKEIGATFQVYHTGKSPRIENLGSVSKSQPKGNTYVQDGDYRLTPRNDDGEYLRVMARAAVRMSADVGSVGGMVSPDELKAILLHAAFPRIEKKIGDQWVDQSGRTNIGAKEGENPSHYIDPKLVKFVQFDMREIPTYQSIYNVNQKLWGRNWEEGRKWSREEVVQAAKDFILDSQTIPVLQEHPKYSVIKEVASLGYSQSNLRTFSKRITDLARSMKRVDEMLNYGKASDGRPMVDVLFPFLNERAEHRPGLNVKQMVLRIKAVRSTPFDLTDIDGARNLANDTVAYDKFVKNVVDSVKDEKAKENLQKLAYDDNPRKQFKTALRFINSQVEFADHMISSRFKDMSSLQSMGTLFKASNLTPTDANGILKQVADLKVLLQKKDKTPFNQVVDRFTNLRKTIWDAHPTNRQGAVDFFDGSMFGSLTDDEHTQYVMRQADLVPEKIIRMFQNNYADLFNIANSTPDVNALVDSLTDHMAYTKEIGASQPDEVKHIVHYGIQVPKDATGIIKDPEVQKLVLSIANRLNAYEGKTAESVMGLFRHLTGKAEISDFDIYDLRGIDNVLRKFRTETGVFKELFGKERSKQEYKRVTIGTTFQNAHTIADDLRRNDLMLFPNTVINEDGSFNAKAQPLKHFNTEKQMFEQVYAQTNTPVSHYTRVVDLVAAKGRLLRQAGRIQSDKVDEHLASLVHGITRVGTTDDHAMRLFQVAVARMEYEGYNKEWEDSLVNFDSDEQDIAKAREVKQIYFKRLTEHDPYTNEFGEQSFNYQGKVLTGNKIIEMQKDAAIKLGKWYREFRIVMGDEWIQKNIKVLKNGLLDTDKSFLDMIRVNTQEKITEADLKRTPVDGAMLAEWYDGHHAKAIDEKDSFVRPTLDDVEHLRVGSIKDVANKFDGLQNLKRVGQRQYLVFYDKLLKFAGDPTLLQADIKNTPQALAYKQFMAYRVAKATGGDIPDNDAIRTLLSYYDKKIPRWDMRKQILGRENYSQYDTDIKVARGEITPYEYLMHTGMNEQAFYTTGNVENYFPHMNFDQKVVKEWGAEQLRLIYQKYGLTKLEDVEKIPDPALKLEVKQKIDAVNRVVDRQIGEDGNNDGLISEPVARAQLDKEYADSLNHLYDLGGGKGTSNILRREAHIPGYEVDPDVYRYYGDKLDTAAYNNVVAFQANRIIRDFVKGKSLGPYTADWEFIMRDYVRATLGYPSIFPKSVLDNPTLDIQSKPYYWLSDEAVYAQATKMRGIAEKIFGKDFTPKTVGDRLRQLKNVEGRYEMSTLLASSKSLMTLLVHGSVSDAAYVGARYVIQGHSLRAWQRINPEFKDMQDVRRFIYNSGAIEDYMSADGGIVSRRYGVQWAKFRDALIGKLKQDPEYSDVSMKKLASDYGVLKAITDGSGAFVRYAERKTRENAFMSTYMATKAGLEPMQLKYDDPYLIEQAIKGMNNSQFLSTMSARSMFGRTNLGQIYTRYKQWGWSSVMSRRMIYEAAAARGFRPGSHEYERFKRRFQVDVFLVGLAALLPYSLFGSTLPPPLSYFQHTADWLWGNSKERDNAFAAARNGLPVALAPLQELMPTIARWPKGIMDIPASFKAVWGGDWQRVGEMSSYSLFPFGRMTKDVFKAYQDPARAVDILTGLPFTELGHMKKKGQ